MKAAPFAYVGARSAEEAVAALTEHGEDAKILAGGQSLLPMMALRLVRPSMLIDLGRAAELAGVSRDDGHVVIGATTTHTTLARDVVVGRHCPLLATVVPLIAHDAIRNRGTLGGSLAHNDPAAELPAAVLLLDAAMVARGPAGERVISADDFFVSYLTTALAPDEVLVSVRVPLPTGSRGSAFQEVSRRAGDFAVCGAGAAVDVDAGGRVARARLAFIGVASTAVRTPAAEEIVTGTAGEEEAITAAAEAAAAQLDPPDDIHASGAYRRHIARLLAGRVLRAAIADARRAGPATGPAGPATGPAGPATGSDATGAT